MDVSKSGLYMRARAVSNELNRFENDLIRRYMGFTKDDLRKEINQELIRKEEELRKKIELEKKRFEDQLKAEVIAELEIREKEMRGRVEFETKKKLDIITPEKNRLEEKVKVLEKEMETQRETLEKQYKEGEKELIKKYEEQLKRKDEILKAEKGKLESELNELKRAPIDFDDKLRIEKSKLEAELKEKYEAELRKKDELYDEEKKKNDEFKKTLETLESELNRKYLEQLKRKDEILRAEKEKLESELNAIKSAPMIPEDKLKTELDKLETKLKEKYELELKKKDERYNAEIRKYQDEIAKLKKSIEPGTLVQVRDKTEEKIGVRMLEKKYDKKDGEIRNVYDDELKKVNTLLAVLRKKFEEGEIEGIKKILGIAIPKKKEELVYACPVCGTEVREDDKICKRCGSQFE